VCGRKIGRFLRMKFTEHGGGGRSGRGLGRRVLEPVVASDVTGVLAETELTASNIARSTIVASRSPSAAGEASEEIFPSQSVITSAHADEATAPSATSVSRITFPGSCRMAGKVELDMWCLPDSGRVARLERRRPGSMLCRGTSGDKCSFCTGVESSSMVSSIGHQTRNPGGVRGARA
jgi:hypothetical protein